MLDSEVRVIDKIIDREVMYDEFARRITETSCRMERKV